MKKFFFISYLLGLVLLQLAFMMEEVSVFDYYDLMAIITVLLIPIFLIRTQCTGKEFFNYFKISLEKADATEKELRDGIVFFKTLQKLFITTSVFTVLFATIKILSNVESVSLLGANIALAIVSAMYCTFLMIFVTIPFKGALEKKLNAFLIK